VDTGAGIVLLHGAGSSAQAPLLGAVADAFSTAGLTVLRCDLPYRQQRRYGPPRPGEAERDRRGIEQALAALRSLVSGAVFLGGHSYGGRQATILAAEKPDLVAGLLLLSYPLHAPGKPDQQRVQHLPNLRTDSLYVHGTGDPFGSIAEMDQALKLIPVRAQLLRVEGAGHDLDFKKRRGTEAGEQLIRSILTAFTSFFGRQ